MAQIIWTEPALIDLDKIAEYIPPDKPEAANNLVKKVFSSIERPEQFPESGRKPEKLLKSKYREIIIGPCRIFYQHEKEKIFILDIRTGENS